MRQKMLAATVLVVGAMLSFTGIAGADVVAETTVTIKAEGRDLFGYVKSPSPLRCADDRIVKVFKVTQDGNQLIGTDNASLNGDRYMWSLGNTGLRGKFFAKAPRIDGCEGDKSETILVR